MNASDLVAWTERPKFRLINPANSSLRHLGRRYAVYTLKGWLRNAFFKTVRKVGRMKKFW